jgi:hypothetical protein
MSLSTCHESRHLAALFLCCIPVGLCSMAGLTERGVEGGGEGEGAGGEVWGYIAMSIHFPKGGGGVFHGSTSSHRHIDNLFSRGSC